MNRLLCLVALLAWPALSPGKTNEPARLALISLAEETRAAADLLTVLLSTNPGLQLLERNEIERVCREQRLSVGTQAPLQLGRLLGADGLLLLELSREAPRTNLRARLVAVKPGVVLRDRTYPWPLTEASGWGQRAATELEPFYSKLTVLAKEAIPVSVVNLRSAAQSASARDTERQLRTLTIQRLSRERRLFVLERERMRLLEEEKEWSGEESAFWSGSYVLEGAIDPHGSTKEALTLEVRLAPPKGAPAALIQVSGSRTNLVELANQLALKINAALNLPSSATEWAAADEAAQYLAEAQWALRWGMGDEAEAAADSAWALGRRDLDCHLVRTRAYLSHVPVVMPHQVPYRKKLDFVHMAKAPDPEHLEAALRGLRSYEEFSRTWPDLAARLLQLGTGPADWHNSDWHQLGLEALIAASQILLHFNSRPESQEAVADRLAELRALARTIAELIARQPSVRARYYVGDRLATQDELGNTIREQPNIFECQLRWGCLWQETPEAALALYRGLMASPVYCYLHQILWSHHVSLPPKSSATKPGLSRVRLVGWNETDRRRLPVMWADFVEELNASTNVLLRMEAKAFAMEDAKTAARPPVCWPAPAAIPHSPRWTSCAGSTGQSCLKAPSRACAPAWGIGSIPGGTTTGRTIARSQRVWRPRFAPRGSLSGTNEDIMTTARVCCFCTRAARRGDCGCRINLGPSNRVGLTLGRGRWSGRRSSRYRCG